MNKSIQPEVNYHNLVSVLEYLDKEEMKPEFKKALGFDTYQEDGKIFVKADDIASILTAAEYRHLETEVVTHEFFTVGKF